VSFIIVGYDVKIYMLILSHNGMASVKNDTKPSQNLNCY